jgi:C_GCAxxG_C_C family probable redox protein
MTAMDPSERQQILDRAYQAAYEYEQTFGSCPQCVLAAIQDVLGTGGDDLFKAAHGLAGGGALTQRGTCGALAGAMLAVGAEHGRSRADFAGGPRLQSYLLAKKVFDAFVEEFGSPICADIQTHEMGRSYDLWDEKDFEAFLKAGAHEDKCTKVAGTAARIAAGVLLDARDKAGRKPRR